MDHEFYEQFERAPRTAMKVVMEAMREYAVAAHMPPKFTAHIKAEFIESKGKKRSVRFYNDWVRDDKYNTAGPTSLASIFEDGSKRHIIKPRFAKILAFITYEGDNFAEEIQHYRKYVVVSGIPGLQPMRHGFARGKQRLKQILQEGKRSWSKHHTSRIRQERHYFNPSWSSTARLEWEMEDKNYGRQ